MKESLSLYCLRQERASERAHKYGSHSINPGVRECARESDSARERECTDKGAAPIPLAQKEGPPTDRQEQVLTNIWSSPRTQLDVSGCCVDSNTRSQTATTLHVKAGLSVHRHKRGNKQ